MRQVSDRGCLPRHSVGAKAGVGESYLLKFVIAPFQGRKSLASASVAHESARIGSPSPRPSEEEGRGEEFNNLFPHCVRRQSLTPVSSVQMVQSRSGNGIRGPAHPKTRRALSVQKSFSLDPLDFAFCPSRGARVYDPQQCSNWPWGSNYPVLSLRP